MRNCLLFFGMVFFFLLYSSLFIVQEGQRGIVLRFGKVLRDVDQKPLVYDPGLHVKIPFIETVKNLDARIQTMENQADRFVTMEKKDLIVDSYVKWRISDFSRYYLATGGGDISQAEVLIKRKFSDRLRSELGKLDVQGIVTDSRNRLMNDVRDSLNFGTSGNDQENSQFSSMQFPVVVDNDIITSSSDINYLRLGSCNDGDNCFPSYSVINFSSSSINNPNSVAALGIEVVDVRIKQINLPTEVSDAIYQRMRAEREAVARRHRSQGQEVAEKLRATADYEVTRTLAEAERRSLIIRGEADSEVAKLYASVFSEDPYFYSFVRSLNAYENSFSDTNNNIMVLSQSSDFFRFMNLHKKDMINSK